jgi:hypothetical protein
VVCWWCQSDFRLHHRLTSCWWPTTKQIKYWHVSQKNQTAVANLHWLWFEMIQILTLLWIDVPSMRAHRDYPTEKLTNWRPISMVNDCVQSSLCQDDHQENFNGHIDQWDWLQDFPTCSASDSSIGMTA